MTYALPILLALQLHLVPFTPERPVSTPVEMGAAGSQVAPQFATNGDTTLIVWRDTRDTALGVFASRVDASGAVLDPLGVHIGEGVPGGVAWNGQSFVVLMDSKVVFVAPDMSITTRPLDLPPNQYLFAAATPGPDVRFLLIYGAFGGSTLAIVDGQGNVVTKKPIVIGGGWTATGTATGFLLLHNDGASVTAKRIDRDGNVLSSNPSGLPLNGIGDEVLAGADDGFLVVHHDWASQQPNIVAYRLDASGVFTGQTVLLAKPDAGEPPHMAFRAAVTREGSSYIVAWTVTFAGNHSYEALATIGGDDAVHVRRVDEWDGISGGVAFGNDRGLRLLATSADRGQSSSTDVFVRALPQPTEPGESHLVTASAPRQSYADVAAGANGYAVAWGEDGPDAYSRVYVRRFSAAGLPQDDAPIEVFRVANTPYSSGPPAARILSGGDVYLLIWPGVAGPTIRRLDAATGAWMDPAPISFGAFYGVFGSNGHEALAFSLGFPCAGNETGCLATRRIAFNGPPLPATVETIGPPGFDKYADNAVLASNGSDYLAVWREAPICHNVDLCVDGPSQLYAMRLHADGTAIDPAPLPLDTGHRFVSGIGVAYSDGRYLVTWSENGTLRGTRITTGGTVLDRDAQGGGVAITTGAAITQAVDNGFLLLLSTYAEAQPFNPVRTIEAVTFPATAELQTVGALPRTRLFAPADGRVRSIAAATRGSVAALAYDRTSSPDVGGVPRVFIRLLVADAVSRRRPAGH